jgi:RNA polymerase sigma factor (sigma-70 family)
MQAMDDIAQLREYATGHSERAFETLVSRHVDLVYSSALRQMRDAHSAEEVTQAVFIILARKAGTIHPKTILSGWLFKTTRFVCLAQTRAAFRRHQYETAAQLQSELQPSAEPDARWESMAPLLDEALAQLSEKDRQAVLLRFFHNQSLAEVGGAMAAGEDSARMRIKRALEKLRRFFQNRGVVLPAAAIGVIVSANSVHAAPATLAKSITTMAMTKGVAAGGSTITLVNQVLKLMTWTKIKITVVVGIVAILAAGGGSGAYAILQHSQRNENYFPRESWYSMGFATPEATIKSFMWAKSVGDLDTVLAVATPEMRQQVFDAYFRNKTKQQTTAILRENVKNVTGVRILKESFITENSVAIQMHFEGPDQKSRTEVTLRKIDGEWKVAGVAEQK